MTNMLLAVSHVPVHGRKAVMALPPRYRKVDGNVVISVAAAT